jgi:hypothetical protein
VIVAENISAEHWNWVRNLIREIERDQKRGEFLKQLFQWDLGVREFRKVELSRMILGDPNELDFRYHAICLHSLLAMGNWLVIQGESFDKKDLERAGVEHGHIEAYVAELEQSYREWHHGFEADELKAAQRAIFGGEA